MYSQGNEQVLEQKKKSFTNILILKWYERVSESNNDQPPMERD